MYSPISAITRRKLALNWLHLSCIHPRTNALMAMAISACFMSVWLKAIAVTRHSIPRPISNHERRCTNLGCALSNESESYRSVVTTSQTVIWEQLIAHNTPNPTAGRIKFGQESGCKDQAWREHPIENTSPTCHSFGHIRIRKTGIQCVATYGWSDLFESN